MQKKYKTVLSIAGSDSSGGAGIQADLKVISALGCYGMTVITAITAQNTRGVQAVEIVSDTMIARQLESVLADISVDAIKIGMLPTKSCVKMVAEVLQQWPKISIVLDPVMVATSGDVLAQPDAVEVMIESLFPLVKILTPNRYEASVLSGIKIQTLADMQFAARKIAALGAKNVLVKGGDLVSDRATDVWYSLESYVDEVFESPKIQTRNTHGTGCSLSSAIASCLAKGMRLKEAIGFSKAYIQGAIESGCRFQLGGGRGPIDFFWNRTLE